MHKDVNIFGVTFKRLVNGVIYYFPNAMHQSTLIGRTDIHAWTLANRF